ncbi:MAG: tRNA epoxyqueuosine(34) reductase QueG, partial [Verrucomicrobiae bacterium]|nr:tRNA epoxyqueuosine(34) reductase QueG [Verrucomicrobiae bacterium]
LAEIFTTLELEPDPPDRNRCGVCMRCVLACPTRALIKPFHLDARRCVSYLTIELRGAIPVDLRPLIGNRVFGCDACLEVCPWNKFASAPKLMAQYKWTNDGQLNLIELLNLNQCQFNHRFGDTPIARAKFTGLIRNACVAIGNVGGPDAIPTLQKLAAANDAIIADHAQWALNQIRQRWNAKA